MCRIPGSLKTDHRCLFLSLFRRVTRPHGNSGVVRAKFHHNIPPHAFGASVRVVSSGPSAWFHLPHLCFSDLRTFITCRCFIHQASECWPSCCVLWHFYHKSPIFHTLLGRSVCSRAIYVPHCMNMIWLCSRSLSWT